MILLVASLSIWATDVYAAATVVGQTLISSVRSGRTTFDYTYELVVSNAQPALNSAMIAVTSRAPSTIVLKNSVMVPAIAAGATITTTDTIVIRQDRLVQFSWSSISFTVIPGPGPVAQGQIGAASGGTISVTDTGDPLVGTQVVFPPGALGDPSDTITIGYTNVLPDPFNANAAAAGVIPVSRIVTLDKMGPTPFQLDVMVTMPYSTSALGAPDYPAVVYWDPNLQQYQPVQVVSVDQINGLITFSTKHFTSFVAAGLSGLSLMLRGSIPWATQLRSIDTFFTPQSNGFEVQNFASGLPGASGNGVCFGVASYAAWYFAAQPSANPLFLQYQTASDPGVPHLPQEDAIARELVAKTYIDTVNDFQPQTQLSPVLTLEQFLIQMLVTNSPQLAYLTSTSGAHSVVLYAWDSTSLSFSVYDPNVPAPQPQPPAMVWNFLSQTFAPWTSANITFTTINFDAYGTHYDPAVLNALFASTETGPPTDTFGGGWNFNTLTITSELGTTGNAYPGGPSSPVATVDSINGGTKLMISWNCPACTSLSSATLHVFDRPNSQTTVPIANGGSYTYFTSPFSGPSAELFAFVSSNTNSSNGAPDQSDITGGYSGYQRVELAPNEVVINVLSTLPGWVGLPATVDVGGFYVTNITPFEASGTKGNTCANSQVASGGERGNPLFSASVDPSATFDGATAIEGLPNEESGPEITDNPCSSFFAHEIDANGNGKFWVNATGRGQKFGAFNEDWEYQLRYYSGDPAKNYGDASCTLGTVPNDDDFSGTPVACAVKCNSALLGKFPGCSN
jgi:hypothetical protein